MIPDTPTWLLAWQGVFCQVSLAWQPLRLAPHQVTVAHQGLPVLTMQWLPVPSDFSLERGHGQLRRQLSSLTTELHPVETPAPWRQHLADWDHRVLAWLESGTGCLGLILHRPSSPLVSLLTFRGVAAQAATNLLATYHEQPRDMPLLWSVPLGQARTPVAAILAQATAVPGEFGLELRHGSHRLHLRQLFPADIRLRGMDLEAWCRQFHAALIQRHGLQPWRCDATSLLWRSAAPLSGPRRLLALARRQPPWHSLLVRHLAQANRLHLVELSGPTPLGEAEAMAAVEGMERE